MPQLFFADLVRESTTATGSSSLALAGAVPGHRSFADAVPSGARFHYSIAGVTHEHEWEVGEGEIIGGALANRTVLVSSHGDALVDFSPGLKIVTLTVAAQWFAAREDRAGHDHAIADVTGLQSALDAKQPAGHYAAAGHGHASLALEPGSAASPALAFAADTNTGAFLPAADCLAISTGGTERARIAADGRMGIGTSSPLGALHVVSSGFNPNANLDGAVMVGGPYGGGLLLKDSLATAGLWTSDFGYSLHVGMGPSNLIATLDIRQDVMHAAVDSAMSLGRADRRWTQLYATDGAIHTSDARDKHWIGGLDASEIAAGRAIMAELGLFQWLAARDAKGPENARLHHGVRAQNAFDILTAHGLDWRRYGWCCHDVWEEDDDGAHDRFGIRSDQLALFLINVLAQQVAELSAMIAAVPDAGA
ncbi:tail fiber domain-containing protein [Blastomonas sp. AAP53]|uniref:tail fiber domain-containing protein n=1 Tax=Blastomonas sp. AAP53 TaxID=1248760 RepID=UPI0002EF97CD|nr:tail fiber domain-containing protein [Blastomonas sp. AAP53]